MKIEVDRKAERLLRELISKNSRYGTMSDITSEAIESFYQSEKKRRFKWSRDTGFNLNWKTTKHPLRSLRPPSFPLKSFFDPLRWGLRSKISALPEAKSLFCVLFYYIAENSKMFQISKHDAKWRISVQWKNDKYRVVSIYTLAPFFDAYLPYRCIFKRQWESLPRCQADRRKPRTEKIRPRRKSTDSPQLDVHQ